MTTRDLLSGPITLSAAIAKDRDVLHALKYPQQQSDFYKHIESYRPLLSDIVAHHLGVQSTNVDVSPQEYWIHGSFNLCVPIQVKTTVPQFVLLRFPLPYRVGEAFNPGNSDEKLNSEAATYAWLHENCPSVPIPQLYGFGLSNNERFTNLDLLPWWSRLFQRARRTFLTFFSLPRPSNLVPHCSSRLNDLDIGYLLIQSITPMEGELLADSWDEKYDDVRLQNNLQRDLVRIMLSLSRVPLPRIGAFRLDRDGYLQLDYRPLSVQSTIQENEGIPVGISRHTTFSRADDFILHHLTAFDNRLIHQPNAIAGYDDALKQMTSLTVARTVFPQIFRSYHGPFVFTLTDLHRSNIFVDEDWNVTCIIDLEFACSLPIEFVQPPYWLGGKLLDEIEPTDFAPKHTHFVELMKQEELQSPQDTELLSSAIQRSWTNGAFWVTLAVRDPVAFTGIFYNRILPNCFRNAPEKVDQAGYEFFARFWRPKVLDIIDKKLQDRAKYLERLHMTFAENEVCSVINHVVAQ